MEFTENKLNLDEKSTSVRTDLMGMSRSSEEPSTKIFTFKKGINVT